MALRQTHMKIWLTLLSVFLSLSALSQGQLKATVLEAESKEEISGVLVYVANSSIGAISDSNGLVVLDDLPYGSYELVVSRIGYKAKQLQLNISADNSTVITAISLHPIDVSIDAVLVESISEKKRSRFLSDFKSEFLGTTAMAKLCEIVNIDDLHCYKEGATMYCEASQPIRILNPELGYELVFMLESFEKKGLITSYSGKPYFNELGIPTEEQLANRNRIYRGSLRHFFRSLLEGNSADEGFVVHRVRQSSENTFVEVGQLVMTDIVSNTDNGIAMACSGDLKVQYTKAVSSFAAIGSTNQFDMGHPAEGDLKTQDHTDYGGKNQHQASYLKCNSPIITISEFGQLSNANSMVELGYWSTTRVGEMLPVNFIPIDSPPIEHQGTTSD